MEPSVTKEKESHDGISKVRVLCFDDGGARCLSSLLVLQRILQHPSVVGDLPQTLKPCHYFDLICGSGFGGVIALLLGRLEMVRLSSRNPF